MANSCHFPPYAIPLFMPILEPMKRFFALIMPLEWILLVCSALTLLLYRYFELPMPGAPGADASKGPLPFYLKQILTSLDIYCLVFLGFIAWQVLASLRRHNFQWRRISWGAFWKHILTRFHEKQILQDIRFVNAILVMFILFGLLKNLIPLVNPVIYDDWFLSADQMVCAGVSCSEYLHSLFGRSPAITEMISRHYFWYYPYMSLVAFLFIVCAPRALAHEYLCAFVTVFILGTLIIYLAPTWGPVYYNPASFEFIRNSEVGALQDSLWRMKGALEIDRSDRSAIFMISGFPSLHVAVVTLGSIYLARLHRMLAWCSWGFALLTLNSTIYLGWHYLLDDVGALGLVWIAWRCARWCASHWNGINEYTPSHYST